MRKKTFFFRQWSICSYVKERLWMCLGLRYGIQFPSIQIIPLLLNNGTWWVTSSVFASSSSVCLHCAFTSILHLQTFSGPQHVPRLPGQNCHFKIVQFTKTKLFVHEKTALNVSWLQLIRCPIPFYSDHSAAFKRRDVMSDFKCFCKFFFRLSSSWAYFNSSSSDFLASSTFLVFQVKIATFKPYKILPKRSFS
jgi:hypothetical protein